MTAELRYCTLFLFVTVLLGMPLAAPTQQSQGSDIPVGSVLVFEMKMPILQGALTILERTLKLAEENDAKAVLIYLDTPGGALATAKDMTQLILRSKIPVVVYVAPQGASATSAGVFVLMAAHIAAMAPGTTVGAAHPVGSSGEDIKGDMREKVENFTASMAKAIAETRGRNAEWAEKSVKESSSITENEALKLNVIDVVAPDIEKLLEKARGREVKNGKELSVFPDLVKAPLFHIEPTLRERAINILSDPNIVALLWILGVIGITFEVQHPGMILPGIIGAISLVLALAMSQIIPVSVGAIALIVLGVAMIALELYVTSGALGIGGIIALVLGALYLVDVSAAPGLGVDWQFIVPSATVLGILLLAVLMTVAKATLQPRVTGAEAMIGARGKALETVSTSGSVLVQGEIWKAVSVAGIVAKDSEIEVLSVRDGLILEIREVKATE